MFTDNVMFCNQVDDNNVVTITTTTTNKIIR